MTLKFLSVVAGFVAAAGLSSCSFEKGGMPRQESQPSAVTEPSPEQPSMGMEAPTAPSAEAPTVPTPPEAADPHLRTPPQPEEQTQ